MRKVVHYQSQENTCGQAVVSIHTQQFLFRELLLHLSPQVLMSWINPRPWLDWAVWVWSSMQLFCLIATWGGSEATVWLQGCWCWNAVEFTPSCRLSQNVCCWSAASCCPRSRLQNDWDMFQNRIVCSGKRRKRACPSGCIVWGMLRAIFASAVKRREVPEVWLSWLNSKGLSESFFPKASLARLCTGFCKRKLTCYKRIMASFQAMSH